jgi:A/G-specific adenine glycosylase
MSTEVSAGLAVAPVVPPMVVPATFAPRLLAWWDVHGRKNLPWQSQRTPYRVWLSEVMLQQTQVATATPYFLRFTQQYPDVQALAAAPLGDVLHLWAGLGYYARARNLHAAAQAVVKDHAGRFPEDLETLQSLPGIGRSTAAAILSLAHDTRHTILDGNVKRVLTRWAGVDGFPGLPAVERRLWALAEDCTPPARNADYTQAIMDLGATLCTRSRPACAICPLQEDCVARATQRQAELPARKPPATKARRVRRVVALVAVGPAGVWLEPRPGKGIWGGLWSLPEFADEAAVRAAHGFENAAQLRQARTWGTVFHSFTHYDLELVPWVLPVDGQPQRVAGGVWYNGGPETRLGLPAPVEKLVAALLEAGLPGQPGRMGRAESASMEGDE